MKYQAFDPKKVLLVDRADTGMIIAVGEGVEGETSIGMAILDGNKIGLPVDAKGGPAWFPVPKKFARYMLMGMMAKAHELGVEGENLMEWLLEDGVLLESIKEIPKLRREMMMDNALREHAATYVHADPSSLN